VSGRVAAIVAADVLLRFRRTSTVIVFLLLSGLAYLWVPDPSTGRALMQIGGRRAVYNSASIAMATALLATLFVGLIGFYVVSNAVRRDAQSRCGFVIASTPTGNFEYIVAKFLGNALFLVTFTAGFMLVSMAMVVVRGEGPLQPLVFLTQYALIVTPAIVFVSATAITFESVPFLSGRFGDVLYFFLWCASLGVPVAISVSMHAPWVLYFDMSGLGFVLQQLRETLHTDSLSIGASPYNRQLPPLLFNGFPITGALWGQRLFGAMIPLPLLGIAWIAFHRFDPVRVRIGGGGRRNLLSRANAMLKPLVRGVAGMGPISTDARMTLTSSPIIVAATIGLAIAAFVANSATVMTIAFAAAAIAIADVSTRDGASATTALIRSAPHLKERFVFWKLASSLAVAGVMLAVPIIRFAAARPAAFVPLIAGTFFVAAAATALGVVSANAKTFIVLFLSFWYVVVSAKGASPALDFAGFYGVATAPVTLAYLAIAAGMLAAAQAIYAVQLRRE
jgi:hypothetical protein